MPLIHSASKKALSKNIATERNAGKPEKQAVAIAESVKRKSARDSRPGVSESEQLKLQRGV